MISPVPLLLAACLVVSSASFPLSPSQGNNCEGHIIEPIGNPLGGDLVCSTYSCQAGTSTASCNEQYTELFPGSLIFRARCVCGASGEVSLCCHLEAIADVLEGEVEYFAIGDCGGVECPAGVVCKLVMAEVTVDGVPFNTWRTAKCTPF